MNYSSIYQKLIKAYSLFPKYFLDGYGLWPIQVYVEVTYRCNLECEFCQFGGQRAPTDNELSADELREGLREVGRGAIISFTGGEPFVKRGFMGLLEGVSTRNRTHIFTNGTFITDDVAGRLVKLGARNIFDKGLVLIGVSLEGLEETHNTIVKRADAFQRTISALRSLVRHKRGKGKKFPLIEIKAVISEKNINEIYPLSLLAKEVGADIFNPMTMSTIPHESRTLDTYPSIFNPPPPVRGVETGLLKEQLDRIRNESNGIQIRTTPQGISFEEILRYYENRFSLKGYTCYFPWHGLGVSARGDVLVCPYIKIGNLREGGLRELFNNQKAREFRRRLKRHRIFPGCLGCCNLIR